MKLSKKAFIIKTSIDNFLVALIMSITASILAYPGEGGLFHYVFTTPSTYYCIPYTFVISWIMTLVIPSCKISKWFASLFKIDEKSYASILVGDLFTNIYITAILSLSCKMLILLPSWKDVFYYFGATFLIMYVVSYIVYELSFYFSNKIAKQIDKKDNDKQIIEQ